MGYVKFLTEPADFVIVVLISIHCVVLWRIEALDFVWDGSQCLPVHAANIQGIVSFQTWRQGDQTKVELKVDLSTFFHSLSVA